MCRLKLKQKLLKSANNVVAIKCCYLVAPKAKTNKRGHLTEFFEIFSCRKIIMKMVSAEEIAKIGSILNNVDRPLKERFRALFTLKSLGGLEAIEQIALAFQDKSELVKHEAAYCLGQMGDSQWIILPLS